MKTSKKKEKTALKLIKVPIIEVRVPPGPTERAFRQWAHGSAFRMAGLITAAGLIFELGRLDVEGKRRQPYGLFQEVYQFYQSEKYSRGGTLEPHDDPRVCFYDEWGEIIL